jgi:hypothetical protein
MTARQRSGLLDQIIEFAIVDTAWEADDANIGPGTTSHPVALWAMAWRALRRLDDPQPPPARDRALPRRLNPAPRGSAVNVRGFRYRPRHAVPAYL